jgi:hypothetical protein
MIFPIESLNKLSQHFFVGVSIIPSLSKAALFLGVAFAAMPERTLANFCGVDGKHFFALYTAFLSASLLVYPDEVLFIGFSFFAFSYLARSLFSAYFSLQIKFSHKIQKQKKLMSQRQETNLKK